MTNYLQKITISNARRFGIDIEIEIGQGATIILAPNGTGKTTVFEAIEFAITGALQRLANPPLSLIRDNQSGLNVRLDFDNEKFCEVTYKKGSEPKLSGNHIDLFGSRESSEIPYLLRLTHLLEQRGSGWFVQQEQEEKAGTLLEKLSIGRDLVKMNTNKTSITRAATEAVQKTKSILESANEELSAFVELLDKRKMVTTEYTLQPLNSLLQQLNEIYYSINRDRQQIQENLNPILGLASQTQSALNRSLENCTADLAQLSSIENLITVFLVNDSELKIKEEHLKELNKIAEEGNVNIENLRKNISITIEQLNVTKTKLESLLEIKRSFGERDFESANLLVSENLLKTLSESITTLKNNLQLTISQLEGIQVLRSKYILLRSRESEALSKKGEISTLETLTSDWKKYQDSITDITVTILPKLEKEKEDLEREINGDESELTVAEQKLLESQFRVAQLRNVSDTILSAVSIIATNLPKDEGDCPVCTAKYEPAELQRRISLALASVNPLLLDAIEIDKNNSTDVEVKKNNLNIHRQNFDTFLNELKKQHDILRDSTSIVNETILPKFPSSNTYLDALEWIRNRKAESDNDLANIAKEWENLQVEPSIEELNLLLLQRNQIEKDIDEIQRQIQNTQQKVESSKETLNRLNQKISITDLNQIAKEISENEKTHKTFNDDLEAMKKSLNEQNSIIEENDKTILTIKGTVAQLTGQQNEIKTRWSQAKLEGPPNLEEFNKKKDSIQNQEKILKTNKEILDKINEELARWKTAEQFDQYTKQIKELSGSLDEVQYLDLLHSNLKKLELNVASIEEKKKTLVTLYAKVDNGIKKIHEYIKSINPLWSALLKRVVVNPRFSEITLDSYSYYNKNQADVKVKLHNDKVKVMEVASEAQITDLQLTFMLSMAKTYNWTSWKALLLDDPTQHHDLVHAAGVFDLLRDNIVEGKFQVLLGTHDSMQARFFQRKLQNDGVPVRLWNLLADDNGVKAELIE